MELSYFIFPTSRHACSSTGKIGTFLTVSDDHWKINKANVVSRQLGFSDACQAHGCSRRDQGSGPIWME